VGGERGDRQVQHLEVVGGGIAAGVAGAQQPGHRRLQAYRASNAAIELKIMIADKTGDKAAVNALHDELLDNVHAHAELLLEQYRYLRAHGLALADEPASTPHKPAARKRPATS
jgi:hypothetical protein